MIQDCKQWRPPLPPSQTSKSGPNQQGLQQPRPMSPQSSAHSSNSWKVSDPLPLANPVLPSKLQHPQVAANSNEPSFAPHVANARWRSILSQLERYLDVESLLTLRSCATVFRTHRYKLGGPVGARVIRFSSLRGFDGQLIVERLLRIVLASLNPNVRSEGVELDLSNCVAVKDSQLAYLVSTAPHFVPSLLPDSKSLFTKLSVLRLDFCAQVSDKGIVALLSSHLPHLGKLSLRCIRSQELTGAPFVDGLSSTLWPKFRRLNADFTSFSLEALTAVAEFISGRHNSTKLKEQGESVDGAPAPATTSSALTPAISFVGSWASKCYLEAIGAKHLVKALAMALNSCNAAEVTEVSKRAQQEIDALVMNRLESDPLAPYVIGQGSKLLMNIPVTCPTSEEGGVNVWTLPISVAVLNGKIDVVEALYAAGAELNVVDHLGKSPVVRAVASGDYEMTKYLLSLGVQKTPFNVMGPSALNVAIERRDIKIARLLLENEFPLNLKCPAIKSFKSPLHVACEVADEALIHSLLDWGANPNSISGTYKNSPAMLAYKVNPRFLPVFLQGGPGGCLKSLPLCSEILTAAIAKEDLRSAELLLSLFPLLMTRQHPCWSCPHIQAAKMGKVEVLDGLLATYRSSLTSTKLNASPLTSVEGGSTGVPSDINNLTATEPFYHIKRFHHPLNCIHHSRHCCHVARAAPPKPKRMAVASNTSKATNDEDPEATGFSRLSSHTLERPLLQTAVEAHQNSSTRADSAKLVRSGPFPQSSPARVPETNDETIVLRPMPKGSNTKLKFWNKKSSGVDGALSLKEVGLKTRENSKTSFDGSKEPKQSETDNGIIKPERQTHMRVTSHKHFHCWLTKMQELLAIRDSTTGHTALHYVAEDGRLDCLKVLLKYGAIIDIRNSAGQTPLHCACYENRGEAAEYLIAHGSQLHQRDYEKLETPLMVCIRTRNDSLASMIIKYLKIREKHHHIEPEDDPRLHAVTNDGTVPTSEKGQTVIYYAVYFSRFEIVNELLGVESCVSAFLADEEGMRASCAFISEKLGTTKDPQHQHVMRKLLRLCQKQEMRKALQASLTGTMTPCTSAKLTGYSNDLLTASADQSNQSAPSTLQQSSTQYHPILDAHGLPLPDVPSSSPSLASSHSLLSTNQDGVLATAIPGSDSSCYCYCVECLGFLGSDCSDMGGAFVPPDGQQDMFADSSSSGSRGSLGNDDDIGSLEDTQGGGTTQNRSSRLRRARDKMKLAAKRPFQLFKNRSSDITS
eukprot:Blabericola_migrator_1__9400@NODE_507_length_7957_cov_200_853612_g389_i0_p1_GENE_NODE_507_length_7957_cov_200_853612_g389_i0NODE_507_length_7957_cov_200_853612_g389_i0_p1_ORF_typecomplete_len1255_score177_92Ank_2/PF12796_7/1_4e07Ank_2/PF12796_7/7_2e06Ank_2/PF12796_7/1_5e03Ank_2/PF12796_7/4_2e16Ank_2/PF12796_7/0_08Ank_4/PF13637_6/2_5e08Ank_4/PF13637_6/18Ank_4/PF13637_6/0_0042Ank_4/PF13637_6/5_2e02Ank_4/PF13637_6/3_4e16Ank_4/PF13637_6/0_84Ank_4/PF13637_6/5_3Ank_5/PF13857_6/0_00024Ank_5/PF13857_6/5